MKSPCCTPKENTEQKPLEQTSLFWNAERGPHPVPGNLLPADRKGKHIVNHSLTGPDFIGIGAQKAATTWVFKWLKAHPEIGFAPQDKRPAETVVDGKVVSTWPKELQFLVGKNHDLGWDWYLDLFDKTGRSEKALGEIYPRYLTASAGDIDALRQHCPDVRLLLNLRDPVDRDWSAIRMIANLGENRNKGDLRGNIATWLQEVITLEDLQPDLSARSATATTLAAVRETEDYARLRADLKQRFGLEI